jgi:hypothetical protein
LHHCRSLFRLIDARIVTPLLYSSPGGFAVLAKALANKTDRSTAKSGWFDFDRPSPTDLQRIPAPTMLFAATRVGQTTYAAHGLTRQPRPGGFVWPIARREFRPSEHLWRVKGFVPGGGCSGIADNAL